MTPSLNRVHYVKGKKFQLIRPMLVKTEVYNNTVKTDYCELSEDGWLLVFAKYAWDGASGGIDTKPTIRASCAHDVFYQLMREGELPQECRPAADLSLREIMKEDNAIVSRIWAWFLAVSWFGRRNADPENGPEELIAP